MIPQGRWQRIQSLFEELIDSKEAERAVRLDSACGDDLDLRNSVESLLKSDARREDPLLDVIGEAAEFLLEEHQDRLIATRIGPYRVVSRLGHGGMSTVYRPSGIRNEVQAAIACAPTPHVLMSRAMIAAVPVFMSEGCLHQRKGIEEPIDLVHGGRGIDFLNERQDRIHPGADGQRARPSQIVDPFYLTGERPFVCR